jgi:hydroxymethylbilane synthase
VISTDTVAGSHVRIATRSSPQARTQAEHVAAELTAAHPGLVVTWVFVDTAGDRRADVPLHQIGGQGVFVKEVQRAVLDGLADLAVHSAKDLPSTSTDGLLIGAFGTRRDARDVLVGRSLDDLAFGATVATGSVRRKALLADRRPDLRFVDLRGNIGTRLGKVPVDGALVMAAAALDVLGQGRLVAEYLDPQWCIPQVGQGAVAVECRAADSPTAVLLAAIDSPATRLAVETERAFLAEIGSGCTLPVGAHMAGTTLTAFVQSDDGVLRRGTRTIPACGENVVERSGAAHAALAAARQLADELTR